mmetsp:Transcript_21062/g.49242  ORF Transcript_21062/g.49242 Transcript_21062/m.49242 type:complete len:224 (+) Transcript_21062:445-1116(+)
MTPVDGPSLSSSDGAGALTGRTVVVNIHEEGESAKLLLDVAAKLRSATLTVWAAPGPTEPAGRLITTWAPLITTLELDKVMLVDLEPCSTISGDGEVASLTPSLNVIEIWDSVCATSVLPWGGDKDWMVGPCAYATATPETVAPVFARPALAMLLDRDDVVSEDDTFDADEAGADTAKSTWRAVASRPRVVWRRTVTSEKLEIMTSLAVISGSAAATPVLKES